MTEIPCYYFFMSSKLKDVFVCKDCGYESPRWEGQCRGCGLWNTFEQIEIVTSTKSGVKLSTGRAKAKNLSQIDVKLFNRTKTGISELDRTLGGGLVTGQVILLGGTPGIGKSTILLQLANSFAGNVLYASGEESETQIALRSQRLGIKKDIDIISTNRIEDILGAFSHQLLIVDSIQVMSSEGLTSQAGSVSQVRECASMVISKAKKEGFPVVIVGHITKDGSIAGPKVLEHMVDTVLYLEGDKSHLFRMLRVHKNRFGDDLEVGIFQMEQFGLVGVANPAQILLGDASSNNSGTAIALVLEGSRPLAIEVQALTVKTSFGYPKRAASGFSLNRLQLLCAVIQKRLNLNLLDQDVYVNVASGLNIKEPAVDLAICAAIISSFKGKSVERGKAFFGEVGLSGEIRNVTSAERRIKEGKLLGFDKIVGPHNTKTLESVL